MAEFNTAQLEQLDRILSLAAELAAVLTDRTPEKISMEEVFSVAENAAEIATENGETVYFPWRDEDGNVFDVYVP